MTSTIRLKTGREKVLGTTKRVLIFIVTKNDIDMVQLFW